MPHDRHGAKQPNRFDVARAGMLDDAARFAYVPPERIVELLAVSGAATIVDFGTGTGTYAIELARRLPAATVFALDEQPEMLARLRAKPEAASLRNLHAMSPEELANETGRVDRIFALNVLHELGDEALASFTTLLAPGGSALVVDWNADIARPIGPPNDHVYGIAAARARLAAAGLASDILEGFPYHHAFRARRREG
jgi:SAM-dependent methyltransferase